MQIKPIRTQADYLAALGEVSALIDLDPEHESPEGERLEVIGTLVQAYEARHYPIGPPDPVEAIRFRMEQSGLGIKDLVPFIGPVNRVYQVLARKRPLSLAMIRRIHTGMGIPAEVLIGQAEPQEMAAG